MIEALTALKALFEKKYGYLPEGIIELPPSGSYRRYFRLFYKTGSVIGVFNEDKKENQAFVSFSKSFVKEGLHVPLILAEDLDNNTYLISDLGDITLLNFIELNDEDGALNNESVLMYKKVLENLPLFQIKGSKVIDFSTCYPRAAFDKQSMMWDLNYFKYYFLKLAKISFDEQKLEDDFLTFSDFLLDADCNYFLYRDFQSRNVMIYENEPYFIDYQGGRKGALQYDVASILFEAKTSLNEEIRNELLEHYLLCLSRHIQFDRDEFLKYYYGYVYIRIMQAMGAYGFRGLYEKKTLFLQSIPKAIEHLKWLNKNAKIPISIPELEKVWNNLVHSEYIKNIANEALNLTIRINSFSFKRGIPVDETQHGGGFVFDCRALPNPGKYEQYKDLNGNDTQVIEFLEKEPEVGVFLNGIQIIIDQSIRAYIKRGFNQLMINFGCTGGQHRSIYAANKLTEHIKNKYKGLNVIVRHREQEMKK